MSWIESAKRYKDTLGWFILRYKDSQQLQKLFTQHQQMVDEAIKDVEEDDNQMDRIEIKLDQILEILNK
jgi:hypothetical protein